MFSANPILFIDVEDCYQTIRKGGYHNNIYTRRDVSRRLSRRRLKIFNFFCPSVVAAKKLLDNRQRRLENFNFFLSVGGGWKIFQNFQSSAAAQPLGLHLYLHV
jgi:hypothetical protein